MKTKTKTAKAKKCFFGLFAKDATIEKAHFIVQPIPYEATTSYGKGTKNGPSAIIDASTYLEIYDEELQQETINAGIFTLQPLSLNKLPPKTAYSKISEYASKHLSSNNTNRIAISLGGEHSISAGLVKGYSQGNPNLSVLHLDAHADFRNFYKGSIHSHACAARRISDICPIVSCGVRSLSSEEANFIKETHQNVFAEKSALNNVDKILNLLSDSVYISLDVDILDPSIMPSTGTPEPNGWQWNEICSFLHKIILNKNVIGLDVVEHSPIKELKAPDYTAAKLIYRIMGYVSKKNKWI